MIDDYQEPNEPTDDEIREYENRQSKARDGVSCTALVGVGWKPPFRYDQGTNMIFDSNDNLALDVRGWGHLTGEGGLGMDHTTAAGIQDALGSLVSDLLNRELLSAPTNALSESHEK